MNSLIGKPFSRLKNRFVPKQEVLESKPRIKFLLFLSADIKDSTQHKQEHRSDALPQWQQAFEDFHNNFPLEYYRCSKLLYDQLSARDDSLNFIDRITFPPIPVWKRQGDEIIFLFELESHLQIIFFVWAFKNTIYEYNYQSRNAGSLLCKGTAWFADVSPFNQENTIVPADGPIAKNGEFYIGDATRELTIERNGFSDYIGPSIDIGFRLSKPSDISRIVVSPEIAYFFSRSPVILQQGEKSPLNFYYGDPQVLKGISEKKLDLFWIRSSDDKLEEKLSKEYRDSLQYTNGKLLTNSELKESCDNFFQTNNQIFQKPYILGDPDFPPSLAVASV